MADEVLINRLYDIVDEITRLGGEQERTSIVPGVLVANANPSDLPTGYIKIVNPKDGGYVPCLTINGLVVADNDLLNVLFTKGTEPIALSQSSQSPSNSLKVSEVWESDFGAVALQADASGVISIVSDLAHVGDADTKISFTDDDIELTVGGLSMLKLTETTQDLITFGPGSGDVDIDFNGDMFLLGSNGFFGINNAAPAHPIHIINGTPGREGPQVRVGASSAGYFGLYATADNIGGTMAGASLDDTGFIARTTTPCFFTQVGTDGSVRIFSDSGKTAGVGFSPTERMRIRYNGVSIGTTTTGLAQLHVDQSSTTGAIPSLALDQADLSEEFINFIATIGAGNPIDTAAIGTYYGKIRVAVNGTFKYIALYNT